MIISLLNHTRFVFVLGVHGGDESMVQKMFFLQEVLRLIDAVNQVAADLDSEDDFDGEWCDEDGNLNL